MIDLGRETDGKNEIYLGVRFALCIIKALLVARKEHCSGTVVIDIRFLLHSPHSLFLAFPHFATRVGVIQHFLYFVFGLLLPVPSPVFYYRKRGSASYIVREVHSVREREINTKNYWK